MTLVSLLHHQHPIGRIAGEHVKIRLGGERLTHFGGVRGLLVRVDDRCKNGAAVLSERVLETLAQTNGPRSVVAENCDGLKALLIQRLSYRRRQCRICGIHPEDGALAHRL